MNAIHQIATLSEPEISGASHEAGSTHAFDKAASTQWTLRRTGRKPVRFQGWQVLEARSLALQGGLRHDLNIYRTIADAIVVELSARRSMLDEADLLRVEVFANLANAAAWLQAYQCTNDIPVDPELAGGDAPLAVAVMQTVRLRRQMLRVEEEYQALLSDVFVALDLTDCAESLLSPVAVHNAVC